VAASPELVAPGVYRVDAIRLHSAINVLLLDDDDGWTLVDTGTANSAGRIQEAITALGSGPEDLKHIFVTHHHPDHAGGVQGLIEWAPQAEIGAPEHEAEIIAGRRAPDEPASAFFRPIASRQNVPPAPVAKVLSEGDLVSGFRIFSTPGHSLGHVSLLRDADGVLFTADAFGCLPRKIRVGVRKYLCADPPLARRSAGRLLGEDFSTVIFAHGKTLRERAKDRLREVVARCRY
jgi:glyoxylase-like metal-dependent hydrolase (beta-lactamase superfamily II)